MMIYAHKMSNLVHFNGIRQPPSNIPEILGRKTQTYEYVEVPHMSRWWQLNYIDVTGGCEQVKKRDVTWVVKKKHATAF